MVLSVQRWNIWFSYYSLSTSPFIQVFSKQKLAMTGLITIQNMDLYLAYIPVPSMFMYFSIIRLDTRSIYLITTSRNQSRTNIVGPYMEGPCMVEGFENNYGSRAVLWRNMTRITILFENSAARLLPNGQRFEDRFPFFFPCRNWCQQRSHYSFFISLGALTPVAGQSEAQISYSGELFPEPRSLPRLQLPFTGRKHKVRKFVLPYFSGRLFSKGLVKLSVAEGFDLWRC